MTSPSQAGAKALAALDQALAHRPQRDGDAFSAATEHLCQLREALTAHCREGGQAHRATLDRLNAVISLAVAGHFPLGETPWPAVQTAAESLRTILAELPS